MIVTIQFSMRFNRELTDRDFISVTGFYGLTNDGHKFGFDFTHYILAYMGDREYITGIDLNVKAFPGSDRLEPADISDFSSFLITFDDESDLELIEVSKLVFAMSDGRMITIAPPARESYAHVGTQTEREQFFWKYQIHTKKQ